MCGQTPKDIFHTILDCRPVLKTWEDIEPLLLTLHPTPVSDTEKAFGMVIEKPQNQRYNRPTKHHGIHVRNWLTYLLRRTISKVEKKAHHSTFNVISKIKKDTKSSLVKELDKKLFTLHNDDKIDVFDQFFAFKNIICKKTGEATYKININRVFPNTRN